MPFGKPAFVLECERARWNEGALLGPPGLVLAPVPAPLVPAPAEAEGVEEPGAEAEADKKGALSPGVLVLGGDGIRRRD